MFGGRLKQGHLRGVEPTLAHAGALVGMRGTAASRVPELKEAKCVVHYTHACALF